MKLETYVKIVIIVGFILLTVGVIVNELTPNSLHPESIHLSDIPLWIRLVDYVPTYLVFVGIITIIVGFIIRKQNTGGMRDMRK